MDYHHTEKLLIQIYKHINESRNLTEQLIDQMGHYLNQLSTHSSGSSPQLPDDIQELVQMALELSPEQRKTLRLFLQSIKEDESSSL